MIATLHDAVLQVLTYVVPFLGILMAIVFVHELGHFLAGRWCGIEVKTFSLGFGRVLWSFHDRHGTRWQLAAIPLGGYVKFAEDSNAASVATGKQPSPGSAGGAFHNSALWKRVVVVAAGPLANFVFATLIYALLNFAFGSREFPSRIGSVAPDSPAARAGLKAGDVITAIDGSRVVHFRDVERLIEAAGTNLITVTAERAGKTIAVDVTPRMSEKPAELGVRVKVAEIGIKRYVPTLVGNVPAEFPAAKAGIKVGDRITAVDGVAVDSYDDLVAIIFKSADKQLRLSVERAGTTLQISVTPIRWQAKDENGKIVVRGRLGVGAARPEARRLGLINSVAHGLRETGVNIAQTMSGIRDLFTSRNATEQMGGPILMAEATAEVVQLGLEPMLMWMALLSANLGFFNLLPIPVLDGGHLAFYALEAIRRRPLSARVHAVGYRLGFAFIIGLMVYINMSDLLRLGRRLM